MGPNRGQKTKKRREEEPNCVFCGQPKGQVLEFGKMIKFQDLFVHYFCLLLSSGLSQRGADSDGIFGFLIEDILKEKKRGDKLKCSYCRKSGATIGCSIPKCKKAFHLPCGLRNQTLHQFFDKFDSYCVTHRPKQSLDESKEQNDLCSTCRESVGNFDAGINVLVTPCCHKLFHRICIERQALSAGYFFKCPLCNDGQEFKQTMLTFGIYVPKQDASWEQNNAFEDLYRRHSSCDQHKCLCPNGREHNDREGRQWQILICHTCGSKGTHWTCIGTTEWMERWVCDDCESIEQRKRNIEQTFENINQSDDESDVEIINTSSPSTSTVGQSTPTIQKSTFRYSTNSNQSFDINVCEELTQKLKKRQKKLMKTSVETKDVGIQCQLVDANDLIDSEPIDDLVDNVFKNATIVSIFPNGVIKRADKELEVIEVDDSDEDCILID